MGWYNPKQFFHAEPDCNFYFREACYVFPPLAVRNIKKLKEILELPHEYSRFIEMNVKRNYIKIRITNKYGFIKKTYKLRLSSINLGKFDYKEKRKHATKHSTR